MTRRIVLDGIDPKMLLSINEQNRKGHWSRTAATRYWRPLLRAALGPTGTFSNYDRAQIDVRFRFPNNIVRDTGNLYPVAKILVDALADWNVILADDDRHVVGPHLWRDWPNGPHRVTIEIREVQL